MFRHSPFVLEKNGPKLKGSPEENNYITKTFDTQLRASEPIIVPFNQNSDIDKLSLQDSDVKSGDNSTENKSQNSNSGSHSHTTATKGLLSDDATPGGSDS